MSTPSKELQRKLLRAKLPKDVKTWRIPEALPTPIYTGELWAHLDDLFREVGLVPWIPALLEDIKTPSPGGIVSANGYCYVTPSRGLEGWGPGTAPWIGIFQWMNALSRASQTAQGQPVVVRVMATQDDGHEYLSIIRKVATSPLALLNKNHCLPLLQEFALEDVIFGVFPKTGALLEEAWYSWAKNSVGDILDMFLQILEGVTFIHGINIAHRDLFFTNFLLDWQPESLRYMKVPLSRPRVHIIDFETAVQFPEDTLPEARVCPGDPCPPWAGERYARPHPPELFSGKPYCPFKVDIWQLGCTFTMENLKTGIAEIDNLFLKMKSECPADRPTADEVASQLSKLVNSIPPQSLLIPPICNV